MFGLFALVVAITTLARGRVQWAHLTNRRTGIVALVVAMSALTISGAAAGQTTPNKPPSSRRAATTHVEKKIPTTTPSVPTTPAAAPITPPPAPVTPSPVAAVAKPKPKPVGHLVITPAGVVLPDPARTPGAINPSVTQATIGQTICVSGWTATVRPSSSVTTALKQQQLASGYAYHGDQSTADYEEDHLISLELGGSPASPSNLWPEPYNTAEGARTKDAVENKLHTLVCNHTIALAAAQRAIATNWWTAYQKYEGTVTTTRTQSTPTPKPAPAAVSPANGATALCQDGTYSYAAHHQGACSHHGGVQIFYK